MNKWIRVIGMMALLALLLTGCSMPTLDDLYCLPKRSNSESNLQEVIDESMDGLQYSAPISGANQQTVQAADLDGDGKDEYILFAKDHTEKPLKILIFSEIAAGYVLMDTIEGNGLAFDFVEYANLDDRPGLEIIVGRQVSDQLVRNVSVYRFASGFARQLMSTAYSRVLTADFDENGKNDLFVIYPGQAEDSPAAATMYSFRDDQMLRCAEVALSMPIDNLKRVQLSKLSDGTTAVFASMSTESKSIITDVFVAQDGQIQTVIAGHETETLRNYYIYPEDIDANGSVDLPVLLPIDMGHDGVAQCLIQWYTFDASANMQHSLTTYHNHQDGWYIRLNFEWEDNLKLVQTEDEFAFSLWDETEKTAVPFFSILILTGPDREAQAKEDGRYLLYKGETEVYVMTFHAEISEEESKSLLNSFRLIRMDWNNEEIREEENEKGPDS